MRKIKFMKDTMQKGVLYKAGQVVSLRDEVADKITKVKDKKTGDHIALDSKEAAKVLKAEAEKKKAELDAQLKELEEEVEEADEDEEEDEDFVGEPAVDVEEEEPKKKPKRRGRKKG